LALIDAQLSGPAELHRRTVTTAPLLFVAVGLMIGIVTQSIVGRPLWFWLILLVLGASAAIVVFAIRKEASAHPFAYIAVICFASLGAIRLISFSSAKGNDIRNLVGDQRILATIRGRLLTEPHINRNPQWAFAKFQHTDPSCSFYLKIREVKTLEDWAEVTGTVRVYLDQAILDLGAGDYIRAYCWLDKFKPPTNPGQFNTAQYLARKNVHIAASVESRDGIELLESGTRAFPKIRAKLRQMASQALLDDMSGDDPSRGMLEALLLGYRGNIDNDIYLAFRKTGLLHFISLSGMHLGILAGLIWWLCKTAGLMKPARAAVCICAVAVFLLIVPPRAPTVRAAIICWVFCLSFFFRRRPNPLNTLSLAAIILLLIRPTQLFEPGWQLSFASVFGILLFSDRIHFFLYEKITSIPWKRQRPKTTLLLRITSRPGPHILMLFSVGLAAWLGGAGILLYHFYTINPVTCIWTVLVFPFVAGILVLGFLKIVLYLLLPTAAAMLGAIAAGLAVLLIWIVRHLANLHVSQILVGPVPVLLISLYYGLVFFGAFVYFRRPVIKKVICTAVASVIILFLGVTKWQRTHRSDLVLTCHDVGHGQAIVAQLPGKANVLFDAGSVSRADVGRRVVAPFLLYKAIDTIDAVVLSHSDIDHINGIPEVVKSSRVGDVYASDAFFIDVHADRYGPAATLANALKAEGHELSVANGPLKLDSEARVRVLWPPRQVCENRQLPDNDKSLVLLIEFAGVKILLCSDIENFAQNELLRLWPDLQADVVVVPHHGSIKTLEPSFLEKLNPQMLISSCGRLQYDRQRSGLDTLAARTFYTARDGAVTVAISRSGTIRCKTGIAESLSAMPD
jgi:competence protein ComEC